VTRGIYPLGLGTLARHSYAVRALLLALGRSDAWHDYLVARNPGAYPPNSTNSLATELGRFDEFSNRALDSLVRIDAMVKERGGELIVLVIPQNFYVGPARHPHIGARNVARIDEIVREGGLKAAILRWCARARLVCLDPSPILRSEDYFPLDGHWNASGHRKVGAWLAPAL
jgi:hypothetical protein